MHPCIPITRVTNQLTNNNLILCMKKIFSLFDDAKVQ